MKGNKNEDEELPGYGSHSVMHETGYRAAKLYLPHHTLKALEDQRLAAEAAQKAKDEEGEQPDDDRLSAFPRPRTPPRSDGIDAYQETAELRESAVVADRQAQDETSIVVYDVLEPLKLVQNLKSRTPDRDLHKRNEALYQRIKPKGHRRALAHPKLDSLDFKRFYRAFPHFSSVINLVREQFQFSELASKPFLIPPILLGGDPGIGKTRFSHELAEALGTVIRRLPFDNAQSGVSLLGSDKNWANTTYGSVFELVVLGMYANPVILLDEIDKASKFREGHALASLHSLLEPITSECVRDISLDFEFNASRVIWIATANDLDRVPHSLRSRFQEFWIEQPTGSQALQMAEVVAREVHDLMDLQGFEPPAKQVVHYIAHLTAREQMQALKRAYAAAKVDGRQQVVLADLPEQVRREASEFAGESGPAAGLLH
nr:AAA family ATPase [uncultured Rhodoferax sp.]